MKLAKIKAQQRLKTGRRLIKYRNCNVFRKYGTTACLNGCHLKNPLNLAVVVVVVAPCIIGWSTKSALTKNIMEGSEPCKSLLMPTPIISPVASLVENVFSFHCHNPCSSLPSPPSLSMTNFYDPKNAGKLLTNLLCLSAVFVVTLI